MQGQNVIFDIRATESLQRSCWIIKESQTPIYRPYNLELFSELYLNLWSRNTNPQKITMCTMAPTVKTDFQKL